MATIAVIDNDKDICTLLTTFLRSQGHTVFCANDGAQGIGVIGLHQPDMVLLDVNMPLLDGHSVIHVMRSTDKMARIPVVVMSVNDDWEMRCAFEAAKCVKFIAKPFELDDLQETVEACLEDIAAPSRSAIPVQESTLV